MLRQPISSTNSTPPQSRISTGRTSSHDLVLQLRRRGVEPGVLQNLGELRETGPRCARLMASTCSCASRDGRAGLQHPDHLPVVAVAAIVGLVLRPRTPAGSIHVDVVPQKLEIRRRHADDLVRRAAQAAASCRRRPSRRRTRAARGSWLRMTSCSLPDLALVLGERSGRATAASTPAGRTTASRASVTRRSAPSFAAKRGALAAIERQLLGTRPSRA